MDENEPECNICSLPLLVSEEIILACKHRFHHECILQSFIVSNKKYPYRECPYCRCVTGFLPLRENDEAIKNIHKEWSSTGLKKTCKAILSSGVNKGSKCSHYAKINCQGYCSRHFKMYMKKKGYKLI